MGGELFAAIVGPVVGILHRMDDFENAFILMHEQLAGQLLVLDPSRLLYGGSSVCHFEIAVLPHFADPVANGFTVRDHATEEIGAESAAVNHVAASGVPSTMTVEFRRERRSTSSIQMMSERFVLWIANSESSLS